MPFFKDIYLNLIDRVNEEAVCYMPGKGKISERLIKCLWMEQNFKEPLVTIKGVSLKILSPGWWNLEAGPDFKNAVISFDGQKAIKGDVEIHVYAKDWQRHGHSQNPGFNNTILHAFLWNDYKKNSLAIHELEILHFLRSDLNTAVKDIDIEMYPHKTPCSLGECHIIFCRSGWDGINKILGLAADARILQKSDNYSFKPGIEALSQLLYEKIMESLGYKSNRKAFLALSKRASLKQLNRMLDKTAPEQRKIYVEALLLGVAGLLPDIEGEENFEQRTYLKRINKIWRDKLTLFQEGGITWSFSACRPANYPHRRIAGISGLIVNMHNKDWLKYFIDMFVFIDTPFTFKRFIEPLEALFNNDAPYWSHHYTYRGKKLSRPVNLIGGERLKTIIINIIIPVLLAYSRYRKDRGLEEKLYDLFCSMPSAETNSITRFMERTLIDRRIMLTPERKQWKKNARVEQGFIQIFSDYCAKNAAGCHDCDFPGIIEKIENY